jgi:DNA-directed RNA polymerase specialized sigma subunit
MQVKKDNFDMTHKEIGEVLGVSRGMVGHIEREAMEKVRKILAERGLDLDDLLVEE